MGLTVVVALDVPELGVDSALVERKLERGVAVLELVPHPVEPSRAVGAGPHDMVEIKDVGTTKVSVPT